MAIPTISYRKWVKYALLLISAYIVLNTLVAIAFPASAEDPQPILLTALLAQVNAEQWHESGLTGQGQPIGIIDRGFGGIRTLLDEGVVVLLQPDTSVSDYDSADAVTGTQSLRVVHEIAPGSDLYACQYTDLNQFIDCIYWMIASDVKIIVHLTGMPVLEATESAVWTREVERVARLGTLWVNAAGNFGQGYLQDVFTDTDDDGFHEFRVSGEEDGLLVEALPDVRSRVILAWEDSADNDSPTDLDIEIYDTDGSRITSSNTVQGSDQNNRAVETAEFDGFETVRIQVRRTDNGSTAVPFHLFVEYGALTNAQTWGSVLAPGDSSQVLSVAALRNGSVAPYSSRGPLASGTIKPDIAAPGEVSLESEDAIGTHVSASVVGGVAALVWQAHPEWTGQQIMEYLLSSTIDDTTSPGLDANYGHGILMLSAETNGTEPGQGPDLPVGDTFTAGLTVRNNGPLNLNVRSGDGTDFPVLAVLLSGESARLIGVSSRNENWYYVELANGWQGWVAATLVVVEGNAANLPRIDPPSRPATATVPPTSTPVPSGPNPPPAPTATVFIPPTTEPPTFTDHIHPLDVVLPNSGG